MRRYALLIFALICVTLSGCASYTEADIERAREEGYEEGYAEGNYSAEEPFFESGKEEGRQEIIDDIDYYYNEYGKSITIRSILDGGLDEEDYDKLMEVLNNIFSEEYVEQITQTN